MVGSLMIGGPTMHGPDGCIEVGRGRRCGWKFGRWRPRWLRRAREHSGVEFGEASDIFLVSLSLLYLSLVLIVLQGTAIRNCRRMATWLGGWLCRRCRGRRTGNRIEQCRPT